MRGILVKNETEKKKKENRKRRGESVSGKREQQKL